jgi:hypothetical protein
MPERLWVTAYTVKGCEKPRNSGLMFPTIDRNIVKLRNRLSEFSHIGFGLARVESGPLTSLRSASWLRGVEG